MGRFQPRWMRGEREAVCPLNESKDGVEISIDDEHGSKLRNVLKALNPRDQLHSGK